MRAFTALLAAALGVAAPIAAPVASTRRYFDPRVRMSGGRCGCPSCSPTPRAQSDSPTLTSSEIAATMTAHAKRDRKARARLALVARGVLLPAKGGT